MATTVNLQDMYSYPLAPIYILTAVIVFLLAIMVLLLFIKQKKTVVKPEPKPVMVTNTSEAMKLKKEYLAKIDGIMKAHDSNEISERICYQKLSICVREFVRDMTGTDTTVCTFDDIKNMKIPMLTALIGEYYIPEFSPDYSDENGSRYERDLIGTVNKTKEAIDQWK